MRSFGSEVLSLLGVGGVAAVLALEMPSAALSFGLPPEEPSDRKAVPASAAVVLLDEQIEATLLRKAKDTWRKGLSGGREYADLSFTELPEGKRASVLTLDSRSRPPEPPLAETGLSPFLPSSGAEAPEKIPLEDRGDPLPFPREELLKID